MKAYHVKYTVEFDIPIKIEDTKMNPNAYDMITALMEQSVKTQLFYFTKQGVPPHSVRAKNIKVLHETSVQDYQI
jgi:hypothetical protein